MADINNLAEIRTNEDLINALSILYFNLNEIERVYYDLFINPVEMDLEVQRYDSQGVLQTISIPNRAKEVKKEVLTGTGNPEGSVVANMGFHYVDTTSNNVYYKSSGNDSSGWILLWSNLNLVAGADDGYLTPYGSAKNLKELNLDNVASGVLAVGRGGTGTTSITGLVKGNGASAFIAAEDGNDYMGPKSMVGVIAYYPIDRLPTGWVPCNGGRYSNTAYAELRKALTIYSKDREGNTIETLPYGEDKATNEFFVPDLMCSELATAEPSYFIRCWDGKTPFNTAQSDNVGAHNHAYSGTVNGESAHTHTKGSMRITGRLGGLSYDNADSRNSMSGAFYWDTSVAKNGAADGSSDRYARFDTNHDPDCWSGSTSGGSEHSHTYSGTTANNTTVTETRVKNKMLVPMIKY